MQNALKASPAAVGVALYAALVEAGAESWLAIVLAVVSTAATLVLTFDLWGVRSWIADTIVPLRPDAQRPKLRFSTDVVPSRPTGDGHTVPDLQLALTNSGSVAASRVDLRMRVTDESDVDFDFRTPESFRFEVESGENRTWPPLWSILSKNNHAFEVSCRALGMYEFLEGRRFSLDVWASYSDTRGVREYKTERLRSEFYLRDDQEARMPAELTLVVASETYAPADAMQPASSSG